MSKLSVKHRKFVEGVLSGKTLVSAYREAGYEVNTDNAAYVNSSRLLRNAKVQAEIKERMDEQKTIDDIRLDRIRSEALIEVHKLIKSATNDDRTKVDMIKDVLDRTGMKVTDKIEHSGDVTFKQLILESADYEYENGEVVKVTEG